MFLGLIDFLQKLLSCADEKQDSINQIPSHLKW